MAKFEKYLKCLLPATLVITVAVLSFDTLPGEKISESDSRNKAPARFDFSNFADPESFYRPGYFWSWNDTMTKELLIDQLVDMKEHGAATVCPLPLPSAFRPVNMPTRMIPDYLTPGYFELFRDMVEKCRDMDMVAYFYDEGGWPSGSCLNKVVEQNPSLVRQALIRKVRSPTKGSQVAVPGDCISAFLFRGSKRIRQVEPGTKVLIEDDSTSIQVFSVTKTGNYPDLLNPESTREFIRLTHEEYKKYIGQYFGSILRIAFTDEPKVANPGWTYDLADDFRKKFGYDIRNELPSLYDGDEISDKKVRIDFFDWWSQRFADAYFGQIQEWCHRNNLLSGGHIDGEDATMNARTAGYGHPLRVLRKMDVPAVDVIWRQLWPGAKNHHFPKYASTVAHQSGLPWAFTESFAVYGNGLTASQMKWISDYQYVRGINLLVLGGLDVKSVCSSNDEIARNLLENQCDFDFIDDDILGSDTVSIKNGRLRVGPMEYSSICISRNSFMPAKSIDKLKEFIRSGGKVIWAADGKRSGTLPGAVFTTAEGLQKFIKPTARLASPDRFIRVCKRTLENGSVYFVTNEDTCRKNVIIEFSEDMPLVRLDPESGRCWVPKAAIRKPTSWEVPLEMDFAGSAVFIFTNDLLLVSEEPFAGKVALQTIMEGWTCSEACRYTIGSHRIEIDKKTNSEIFRTKPGDYRSLLGDSFSGDVVYEVNFFCTEPVAMKASSLDLGEVKYFCRAELNGQDLGRRIWRPFAFDIRGKLKKGNNFLRITVTNTLANQYITTKALDLWTRNQLGPYHARTLSFEKESIPSGLFGPVTVR